MDVAASASREPAGLIASRVIFALLVSGKIIHLENTSMSYRDVSEGSDLRHEIKFVLDRILESFQSPWS